MKRKGTVVQVTGPVVDIAFDGGSLPEINEALSVAPDGQPRMMEVAQHIGGDTVRCIMLSPSEGIGRGDEVLSTGHTIEAPVGEATLGRMFNVLGQPIDEKGDVNAPENLYKFLFAVDAVCPFHRSAKHLVFPFMTTSTFPSNRILG